MNYSFELPIKMPLIRMCRRGGMVGVGVGVDGGVGWGERKPLKMRRSAEWVC